MRLGWPSNGHGSVVEQVPADGAPASLIVEDEFTDDVRETLALRGSIDRVRITVQNALRVLAVPIGIGVGLWMALLTNQACHIFLSSRGNGTACPYPTAVLHADFAWWTCAVFGAAAAVVVLLISLAVPRPTATGALSSR
jgi:hypothetical protein